MKKNVIWWPALNNPNHSDKYGGFGYFEHSRKAWEYWCKKNDCLFVPFTEPVENDFTKFRPQWQKCLFVFDELERMGIEYDQIALVDSTATPHWDCPNFFELTDRKFTAFRDMDNLKWVYESVEGYNDMFEPFIFDMSKYFNSGFWVLKLPGTYKVSAVSKLYSTRSVFPVASLFSYTAAPPIPPVL